MKIELGKRYVRRDGLVTGELYPHLDTEFKSSFPYWDGTYGKSYAKDGSFYGDGTLSDLDLIAAYLPEVEFEPVADGAPSDEVTPAGMDFAWFEFPDDGQSRTVKLQRKDGGVLAIEVQVGKTPITLIVEEAE